jgi:hypothetical protein
VVGGADVDVAEGGGGGEKLVWDAAVGDGLPDEEGFGRRKWVEGLAAEGEDVCDEADAAGGGADEVEGFGVEEDGGVEEIAVLEAEFRGCVVEGAVLMICGVVAVEAAGGEAGWVGAEEARGLPGVDDSGEVGGKVGAAVDYPAYLLGIDWRGRYNARAQRRVCTCAAEDIVLCWFWRRELYFICKLLDNFQPATRCSGSACGKGDKE